MRIIKSGNGALVPERPCTCMHCSCEFVFREDEANLVDDSRDGDYFRVACPQCRVLNSVSVKVPTVSAPRTRQRVPDDHVWGRDGKCIWCDAVKETAAGLCSPDSAHE